MEMIQHRLESDDIISYHSAYRTIAVNVLGPGLNNVHVLFEDGKIFKETDLLHSTNLYFLWLLTDFIPFADSLKMPWMITNGDAFLLDKITFSDEELSVLREKGLLIFMYEPLFLLNQDRSWPWTGKGEPLFVELDEIDRLRQRFQIPIHVLMCELDMPEYLRTANMYPDLKFHGFSSLLMHESTFRRSLPWPTSSPEKIEKHLISLNFRYESIREMLVGFLAGKGHIDKCYVSFYHEHDYREFKKRLPFPPQLLGEWPTIEEGIRKLQPFLPLTLDAASATLKHPSKGSIPDMNGTDNIRNYGAIKDPYMTRSFAFAYCESRPFSPRSEISEKTLDALQAMKPFVVFAAPYFYRKLRELGFKTFSKYWNEDFDNIEDPRMRYEAFLKTVDFICSQDLETLRAWTKEMKPIVEHNRLLFIRQLLPQHLGALRQELRVQ